jgi:hypothetical protein
MSLPAGDLFESNLMKSKREVLRATAFGNPIAEEERKLLSSYFVETDQWQRVYAGDIDVIFGPKGSGKSAIYALLLGRAADLFQREIVVVAAENPQGSLAFKDIVTDPPTDEQQFRNLWKLYFLILLGDALREYEVTPSISQQVIRPLEEAQLLPKEFSLSGLLSSALSYVRRLFELESVEGGLKIDPETGMPVGLIGKITFREPNAEQRRFGVISVDDLLRKVDQSLEEAHYSIWLLLDRLDVVFAEHPDLERNALRALFRTYLDLRGLANVSLKVFLRTDLWQRITEGGFREASHITRKITISWDEGSLMNLVIRRALHNRAIADFYNVVPEEVLSDAQRQKDLFFRIFPRQVDVGSKKPDTFHWILYRVCDGTQKVAPRELIQLLSAARDVELKSLEVGGQEASDENLFHNVSLKDALPVVSQTRFDQTLCAEFPYLKEAMLALRGEKTRQTLASLAATWRIEESEALSLANQLVEVGFFESTGTKDQPEFWVPFLYRSALNLVQGTADDPDLRMG